MYLFPSSLVSGKIVQLAVCQVAGPDCGDVEGQAGVVLDNTTHLHTPRLHKYHGIFRY